MSERDYSLMLAAGRETTINAGEYDRKRQRPAYSLTISSPFRHEIQEEQFLVPTADGHLWTWRVKNNSSWPAFIIVTIDGKLLRLDEQA